MSTIRSFSLFRSLHTLPGLALTLPLLLSPGARAQSTVPPDGSDVGGAIVGCERGDLAGIQAATALLGSDVQSAFGSSTVPGPIADVVAGLGAAFDLNGACYFAGAAASAIGTNGDGGSGNAAMKGATRFADDLAKVCQTGDLPSVRRIASALQGVYDHAASGALPAPATAAIEALTNATDLATSCALAPVLSAGLMSPRDPSSSSNRTGTGSQGQQGEGPPPVVTDTLNGFAAACASATSFDVAAMQPQVATLAAIFAQDPNPTDAVRSALDAMETATSDAEFCNGVAAAMATFNHGPASGPSQPSQQGTPSSGVRGPITSTFTAVAAAIGACESGSIVDGQSAGSDLQSIVDGAAAGSVSSGVLDVVHGLASAADTTTLCYFAGAASGNINVGGSGLDGRPAPAVSQLATDVVNACATGDQAAAQRSAAGLKGIIDFASSPNLVPPAAIPYINTMSHASDLPTLCNASAQVSCLLIAGANDGDCQAAYTNNSNSGNNNGGNNNGGNNNGGNNNGGNNNGGNNNGGNNNGGNNNGGNDQAPMEIVSGFQTACTDPSQVDVAALQPALATLTGMMDPNAKLSPAQQAAFSALTSATTGPDFCAAFAAALVAFGE